MNKKSLKRKGVTVTVSNKQAGALQRRGFEEIDIYRDLRSIIAEEKLDVKIADGEKASHVVRKINEARAKKENAGKAKK